MKKYLPCLVYALHSFAILGALILPGYILTLDMIFAPDASYNGIYYGLDNDWLSASAPFYLLIESISNIIPAWLVQKVILLLIFFLAGLGMHRLFPFKGVGAYFAGILYMINPFTYVRFMAGQWGVLAAYAITPFAIKAFLDLLEKGGVKNAIKVALISTLVGLIQMHGFFLLFTAYLIILIVKLVREYREREAVLRTGKYVGIAAGMFLGLNLYWWLPAITARETLVEQIGRSDLFFFAPKAISGFGTMFDLSAMYGFWREGYTYAKDFLPIWWLVFVFIFYLAVCGFIYRRKDSRIGWIVWSFGLIWLAGLVFSAGAAIEFTRSSFEWLFDHLLIFRGFRDSQKFVVLICLSYAFLGGLGVNQFVRWCRDYKNKRVMLYRIMAMAVVLLAFIAPFVYSYPIFGFHGQLKTTDYPQSWYEVNDYLNQDEDDFNVLFLPWHMFMDFDWLPNKDKRLANPAGHFFEKPVIYGDNIEAGNIYSQSTNPVSKYVEFLLSKGMDINNLGELLAPLNVKYLILVNESDYRDYGFIYAQRDLEIGFEGEGITVFKNKHTTARAYAVDGVMYVDDLEEFLDLSLEQDVMDYLYIVGGQGNDIEDSEGETLEVMRSTPVKYTIGGSPKRWTVFTVPQRVSTEDWQYGDAEGVKNLGFMPAFEVDGEGGQIVYSRFYNWYLPSYIISMLALGGLLAVYILLSVRERRP